MASSVVDAALSAAGSVAAAEIALQLGVQSDLELIKYELDLMQSYLEANDDERSLQGPVARVWARQVRDVAYDVEDCVENSTIHLGRRSSTTSSCWWRRQRWWCSISRILARRRIAGDMRKLRARVNDVFKRRKLYVPMTAASLTAAAAEPPPGSSASTPWPPVQQQEARLVGDLKRSSGVVPLSNLLARRDSSLMVVSIRATAATSTLVGMAYDDLAATGRFRCRAWVTVPHHPFNLAELIRSLLRQFLANDAAQEGDVAVDALESVETMGVPQLVRSLSESLEHKTALLVIDDVSTREEWDSIKLYLRSGVKNSSRIIVTSQREDVAKYCAGGVRNSTCFCLSSDTSAPSAFCNYMDLVEDEFAEVIPRALNHENIASTSNVFEEAGDNSSAITVAEMIAQDQINTMMARVGQAPQLVGREKEMDWITSNICSTGNESNNVVVSVCGKTGIGKTALVQSVYLCEDVTSFFTHRAWITMSNSWNKDELIREVLQHFKSDYPSSCSREPLQKMHMKLAEFYETNLHNQTFRCLVVLDGLSTTSEWDLVHSSLILEDYNKVVFRIILTTRELQVANYCSKSNYIYNLSRLHDDDARKLFRLKVFGTGENVELGPGMAEQATQINVGRHLASRLCTAREWKRINEQLNLDQFEVNSDLGCIRATLETFYNNLPYHVKYCFLYLSIFQEDLNIKQRRLVKRWIAEGYVKGIRGSEAEEVGERVFNEFLNMTIIQPTTNAAITSARTTSCSVHPLMLEVSMSKATEEKLVCMLDYHSMSSEDTMRHVVVRRTWRRDQEHEYKNMNVSRVRSLTVFGEWRSFLLSHKMCMLRVLDLEGVQGLTGKELKHIGVFCHLKYLGLRNTEVEQLPKSLGKLRCLETLDIRNTNVRRLPSVIANLTSLHVLHCGSNVQVGRALGDGQEIHKQSGGDLWGLEIPEVIGELRALNTLGTVSVERQGREVIQKLRNLTQLRRLSVTGITDENGPDLCSTLTHLTSLRSLTARADEPNGLSQSLQASSLLSSLQRLQVLKLYGCLVLPKWILRLRYLFKLHLHNTRLEGPGLSDTIDGLARMPSLTTLLLLENSVMCTELIFDRHVFLELELLELSNLGALSFLSFRAGAMPKLKMLQVDGCNNLEKISVVAGAVPKLETLQIENCDGLRSLSYEGAGIEMPMLKHFQVGGCNNLQLLPFVTGDMPCLYTLLIRQCSNLEVFMEPQAVPKLKMLRIDGCKKLHWLPLGVPAGLGLSFQAGAMPDLKELQLSGCHGLGRLSFGCGAMPKLETLRIKGCANLLDLSFEAGATPKLETFQIDGCSKLVELSGLQHLNLRG